MIVEARERAHSSTVLCPRRAALAAHEQVGRFAGHARIARTCLTQTVGPLTGCDSGSAPALVTQEQTVAEREQYRQEGKELHHTRKFGRLQPNFERGTG